MYGTWYLQIWDTVAVVVLFTFSFMPIWQIEDKPQYSISWPSLSTHDPPCVESNRGGWYIGCYIDSCRTTIHVRNLHETCGSYGQVFGIQMSTFPSQRCPKTPVLIVHENLSRREWFRKRSVAARDCGTPRARCSLEPDSKDHVRVHDEPDHVIVQLLF